MGITVKDHTHNVMVHLSNCVLAQSGNLAGIQGVVGTADPLHIGEAKKWCSCIKWIKMHHFLNLKSFNTMYMR